MSLYNKYRPKTFDNLVQSKFNSKLTKDNLNHHAYLFFGPPGCGKTSTARLCMAEFRKPNENVDSYINGSHSDYHEINCAVNNGVDDIRSIISDTINTYPHSADYKFIIFDEAHMLTSQAMNALLKTIEEPPSHVKFIFCTTEINKVLPAIRSRCQIVPFIKLNETGLIKVLTNVCLGEQFNFHEDSLKLIVSCADGSARAAINLLEQCSTCLDDPDSVAQILGTSSVESFKGLTKAICDKNRCQSISLLEEIFNNSIDPNSLMNKYADYIAELILVRITEPTACEFDGKQLLTIAECVTNTLKDFKILQNIKLISRINFLKAIEKM